MINVNNLNFAYDDKKKILHDLNFQVKCGEIFGFLGPNGSGKSTTQKILMGTLQKYQGKVTVNKRNVKKVKLEFYESIGVLFENPYLYSSLSAFDNLKYFSSFYKKSKVRNLTELLNLVELKPEYHHRQVKHYSKGMKQRVSIARCLLNSPKLLFLDEPISGLDPEGAVLVKKIIKEEKARGTTIFLTTHNMFVADELCDRVAFIVDGVISVIDSPQNLKRSYTNTITKIDYLLNGKKLEKCIATSDISNEFNFNFDKIISVNTTENTLEDIFITITGKGLSNE